MVTKLACPPMLTLNIKHSNNSHSSQILSVQISTKISTTLPRLTAAAWSYPVVKKYLLRKLEVLGMRFPFSPSLFFVKAESWAERVGRFLFKDYYELWGCCRIILGVCLDLDNLLDSISNLPTHVWISNFSCWPFSYHASILSKMPDWCLRTNNFLHRLTRDSFKDWKNFRVNIPVKSVRLNSN